MDIRREILRNVVLCQALEPLAKKPGLTRQDAPGGVKPESLVVAGVNSSWPFFDLADRILRHGKQPEHIYDLAYEALSASGRNRLGNNASYGRIALLIPLVTAQVLEYLDKGSCDAEAILARTGEVLRHTSLKDIEYLEKFVHLGSELSARHRERVGGGTPRPSGPLVLQGQYGSIWDTMRDHQQIHVVRETFQGYPHTLQVHRYLLHNLDEGLLQGSEMIYRVLLAELQHADAVADILVAGLYLTLTAHPESILFT